MSPTRARPRPRPGSLRAGLALCLLVAGAVAFAAGLRPSRVTAEGSTLASSAGPAAVGADETSSKPGVASVADVRTSSGSDGLASVARASHVPDALVPGTMAPVPLLPASLIQLSPSALGAVVIDVDSNRLLWFENLGDTLDRSRELYVAIGKGGPEKQREGDEKTPVGVYRLGAYLEDERLPAIYGAGAFTMDYPNPWDRRLGRTGSGIWIHGTDKSDDDLLPRSSRGCLTVRNADFQFLLEQLQLENTPVIVTRGLDWRPAHELERVRRSLGERIERWRQDWESDTERYLEHYAEDFRSGNMDVEAWRAYKRRVNASKQYIEVALDDLAIFRYPGEEDLFLVTFRQRYRSDNFRSTREKQLYWRRDSGGWRILHES